VDRTSFLVDFNNSPYSFKTNKKLLDVENRRCENVLTRNRHLFKDKVVLDLACHKGHLSYACLALGAKRVIGVEAREDSITEAVRLIKETEFGEKAEFVQADVFDFLTAAETGRFDTILCCGFLYHTIRQVDFFRQVKRLAPAHVIINTWVAGNYFWYGLRTLVRERGHPACLRMSVEPPASIRNTIDNDGIVFWPTCSFLEYMFDCIGYDHQRIHSDWKRIRPRSVISYLSGTHAASYVGHRRGEVSNRDLDH
jgi:hypothetical protein